MFLESSRQSAMLTVSLRAESLRRDSWRHAYDDDDDESTTDLRRRCKSSSPDAGAARVMCRRHTPLTTPRARSSSQ